MDSGTKTCFRLHNDSMTISEAEKTCAQSNSRLAVINIPEVTTFLNIGPLDVNNWTWIGLKVFSPSDMFHGKFSDRSPLSASVYTNWMYGSDTTSTTLPINSNALIFDKEAKWYLGTVDKASALCEYVGICPPGYLLYENSCYKIFEAPRQFSRAQVLCASDGGRLFKLDKESSQEKFFIDNFNSKSFWAGIIWNQDLDNWVTSDGQTIDIDINYTLLSSDYRSCLKITFENGIYLYEVVSCDNELQYVCQIDYLKNCPQGMIPYNRQCVLIRNIYSEQLKASHCFELGTEVLELSTADDYKFGQLIGEVMNIGYLYADNDYSVTYGCPSPTGCLYDKATMCTSSATLCPLNYDYVNIERLENCLKFYNMPSTKSEAEVKCSGHLAHPKYIEILQSYKTLAEVNIANSSHFGKFYVGIQSNLTALGYWTYSDETSMYLPSNSWMLGQLYNPYTIDDNLCAVFDAEFGQLTTNNCLQKLNFICEEPVTSVCPQNYQTEIDGECNLSLSDDLSPVSATCLETTTTSVNSTNSSQSQEILYRGGIFSGSMCWYFYKTIQNTTSFCPPQPSSVCRHDGKLNAPLHFDFLDGKFINIIETPQNYYDSTVNCSRSSSLLFRNDNEKIHNYLRDILTKYGVDSYWVGSVDNYVPYVVGADTLPNDKCEIFQRDTASAGTLTWIRNEVQCVDEHPHICTFRDDLCPTDFQYINGKCYMLYTESMSMAMGNAFCAVIGSKMANVSEEGVDKYLGAMVLLSDFFNGWIIKDYNSEAVTECSTVNDFGEVIPMSCSEYMNPICESIQSFVFSCS
ncbi:C-type mannose receptor 2 [Nymphon striatum]|nr:C-type mannose receptor 2 [Nymphon striatum]